MSGRSLIFLTHAQVEIDPDTPVTDWRLSDQGRRRHSRFADDPTLAGVTAIYSSRERKAVDAAAIHGKVSGHIPRRVCALHENDRSSTGYLPPDVFEATADAFFAEPDKSVDGWERARDAQIRVVTAIRTLIDLDETSGDLLVVAHGAVGALLRCHLLGRAISRDEDQPPVGGGCHFTADAAGLAAPTPWSVI
ncbi:histidine phosphatase family protein [Puniceibacterium sediminis]|uniref:Broad specificity phosphatase PhoE n=1 Tax=Puniceibacterium sediminis TaxID=1608407 RepID=A0A238V2K7_9RHOB|nr:histidine phosphatase family protein [Puniceibacterium sediminis]SNR28381.1 Broad specificity phosphatase PhoE [Puniceibacterium sediminis]